MFSNQAASEFQHFSKNKSPSFLRCRYFIIFPTKHMKSCPLSLCLIITLPQSSAETMHMHWGFQNLLSTIFLRWILRLGVWPGGGCFVNDHLWRRTTLHCKECFSRCWNLHSSFSCPQRTAEERSPEFSVSFWKQVVLFSLLTAAFRCFFLVCALKVNLLTGVSQLFWSRHVLILFST